MLVHLPLDFSRKLIYRWWFNHHTDWVSHRASELANLSRWCGWKKYHGMIESRKTSFCKGFLLEISGDDGIKVVFRNGATRLWNSGELQVECCAGSPSGDEGPVQLPSEECYQEAALRRLIILWIIQQFAIEHGPVEIVDLPIDSMVDLSSSLCNKLPEGVQDFAAIHSMSLVFFFTLALPRWWIHSDSLRVSQPLATSWSANIFKGIVATCFNDLNLRIALYQMYLDKMTLTKRTAPLAMYFWDVNWRYLPLFLRPI